MKKKYIKPVMENEIFRTNAYCGSCEGQVVLNGTLTVSPSSWASKNNNPGSWSDTRQNLVPNDEESLSHTFIQANSVPMTDTWGNPQYFWKCSDGDGYYLEYSAYYTQQNGTSTFFLYKEVNGKDGLQISGGTSWPLQGSGNDLCVAQVVYTQGTDPVVNS